MLPWVCSRMSFLGKAGLRKKVCLCMCVYPHRRDEANVKKCSLLNVNGGIQVFIAYFSNCACLIFCKVKNSEEGQKKLDSKLRCV